MRKRDRMGNPEEIFEILVKSYTRRQGAGDGDLCWLPATDAYETDEEFVVQMDLAGLDPAGIEVLADTESLVVRGVRRDISVPGRKHFHEMEISVGPFSRRVPLTVAVDPGSGKATYRNGFLYVIFAKGPGETGEGRRITIDR